MKLLRVLLLKMLSLTGRVFRRTRLARYAWVNKLHGAVSLWVYGTNEVNIGGFRVKFDARDRAIGKKLVLYGNHEDDEIGLLCSLAKPGDVVLDVGANFGLHSLYLGHAVGPEGIVLAFEPDPDNYALLCGNLKSNGCTNVRPMQCALGDQTKGAALFQVGDNRGNLSFADHQHTGRSVTVSMKRGDEVLSGLGLHARVAKIDVEGAEPLVLAGLGKMLPDIILFEFAPKFIRALNNDPQEFLDGLAADGYALELVDPYKHTSVMMDSAGILKHADKFPFIWNVLARRGKKTQQTGGLIK